MNNLTKAMAILIPLSFSGMASAEFINADLSDWIDEGDGSWEITSGNNAYQKKNGDPTVMFTGEDDRGAVIKGSIKVNTKTDDDYIGLVFGYNQGDYANANADYYLLDWKQVSQTSSISGKGRAYEGLALSHVTGILGEGDYVSSAGAWSHNESYGVKELQRGETLHSTGWEDKVTYDFAVTFTDSLIEVYIDNTKEISYSGDFAAGSFGFYNFSQPYVMYNQIVAAELPTTYEGGEETIEEDTFVELIVESKNSSVSNVSAPIGFASALLGMGLFARRRKQ